MPIPRFTDSKGIAYELVLFCQCGYAVEKAALTMGWKDCPRCGGKLETRRVDYGPRGVSARR